MTMQNDKLLKTLSKQQNFLSSKTQCTQGQGSLYFNYIKVNTLTRGKTYSYVFLISTSVDPIAYKDLQDNIAKIRKKDVNDPYIKGFEPDSLVIKHLSLKPLNYYQVKTKEIKPLAKEYFPLTNIFLNYVIVSFPELGKVYLVLDKDKGYKEHLFDEEDELHRKENRLPRRVFYDAVPKNKSIKTFWEGSMNQYMKYRLFFKEVVIEPTGDDYNSIYVHKEEGLELAIQYKI